MDGSFTVVTPSFRGLGWLKRCVGSVKGQTEVPLEHLVVDGGSDDGTVDFLENLGPRIGSQDSRSGVYHLGWLSEADRGMYDAINKGWAAARGEYLSWLNVDEQYLPGTLAFVREAFESRPDVDVLFGDTIIVDADGAPLAARREIPLRRFYLRNGFLYAMSCATFFRRKLYDSGHLMFSDQFRYAGDFDLMLRLLRKGVTVAHMPRYLSLFGVDGTNLSATAHDAAAAEADLIREQHGSLPRGIRRAAMLGRYLERLGRGCYWPEAVQYAFAVDERPIYRRLPATRIGARFGF